ncbi:RNase P/MRP p29 subunit [Fomitopsis serialis]|uniref:RNase P/MRP p29 subunit n=1 Tax=Fomitopsis serialis TaxID=139415 RepID=UPI0020087B1B|nr:RNase P/MRP p29 subunit [Neoantrodia serialis]KAH9934788.1 RNase P/MRP p29 subunit [Neoantrodia serialis]
MSAPDRHRDIYTEAPPRNNQRVKLNSTTPFTPTYVKDHVSGSAHPVLTYASRVQGRQILLENPAGTSRTKQLREEKKTRRLSDKAKKAAGVAPHRDVRQRSSWQLKQQEAKFHLFLPLHTLWMGYMAELLALPPAPSGPNNKSIPEAIPNSAAMHAKLVKADFHGSIMTVRQSKNPSLVGLSGIVIHETENAFKIVTRKDQLKMVPKQNSIFAFAVPLYSRSDPSEPLLSSPTATNGGSALDPAADTGSTHADLMRTVHDSPYLEFELHGNQFCFRAAERAGRKFKHKETIEL